MVVSGANPTATARPSCGSPGQCRQASSRRTARTPAPAERINQACLADDRRRTRLDGLSRQRFAAVTSPSFKYQATSELARPPRVATLALVATHTGAPRWRIRRAGPPPGSGGA
jgi:hypothetical protein